MVYRFIVNIQSFLEESLNLNTVKAFKINRFLAFFAICCFFSIARAQESVLRSGIWGKVAVEKHGVYKINYDLLKKMGFDPSKIDPRKIKLFGYGGGMLPQPNNLPRPYDLTENAIFIQGESDGRFDRQDFILFYGEGPDDFRFNTQHQIFYYQSNLYSDRNFYFITVSASEGKRMAGSQHLGTGFPVIREFNDFIYHEIDQYKLNDPKSGREWYGEKFGVSTNEHTISFTINGIRSDTPFKIVSDVLSQSYTSSSFKIYMNDTFVDEQKIPPVPNTRYAVKAIHKRDTFLLNSSAVGADTRSAHTLKYEYIKGSGVAEGHLDFFLASFTRGLSLYNNQTFFVSGSSIGNEVSQFELTSATADIAIWDITDPANCKIQDFSFVNGTAIFATATDQLKEFIVFNKNIEVPAFVGKVSNQNLHGLTTPDLVIVTHPDFKSEALRLAAHRQTHNQWQVEVVTPEEIFNEFSSGRQDVSAIRDFVKLLYDKNPQKLKALLLFGKCSYDYKDRLPGNTNFVMTYESRNSLHPLLTYSSDDYFVFLENNEGQWSETPVQNHTLDIGVGRLPVKTPDEARTSVDKIIAYDRGADRFGAWRKLVVFVADDGNKDDGYTTLHQAQANQLATYIAELNSDVDTRKLFMGSYPKEIKANAEVVPKLTDDIIRSFDRGSLIINYTGHGSEKQWADEKVFSDVDIRVLENNQYPFLVTATCEFGRHDNPNEISGAELAIIQKNGGVIGLVTTTRPVNASTNFNLNQAFYEALLLKENGSYLPIGNVFMHTKNNSSSGVSNRNFSLLGDPSLTLALPANKVHVSQISARSGSDTLKALSTAVIKGELRDSGNGKMESFNGSVELTLYDKEADFVAKSKGDAFPYKQWSNALFRGQASVVEGKFELEFVVSKNIASEIGQGKVSLYAVDRGLNAEAIGSASNFKVGGTEQNAAFERNAPQVELFIGDTTFVSGGITTPDTWLVARLKDDTGINISGYGSGNSLMATLDGDPEGFIINDYYVASADTPTSGWVHFPINNLVPGKHRLVLSAWDVHNNPAQAAIEFVVTDGDGLVIESFGNYPNPFRERSQLFFTHNRSGDDLQAQLFILDLSGAILAKKDISIPASDYKVSLMAINSPEDFGKKLSAGLYLARVVVRSLSNGSKNERVTKLIVLN